VYIYTINIYKRFFSFIRKKRYASYGKTRALESVMRAVHVAHVPQFGHSRMKVLL